MVHMTKVVRFREFFNMVKGSLLFISLFVDNNLFDK